MSYDPRMVVKGSVFISEDKYDQPLDLAVVFITTEGIQHWSGGVSKYIRNFIEILVRIRPLLDEEGIKLTLYAAEPGLLHKLPTYDKQGFKEIKKKLESTNGGFYKLVNNTYGEDWIESVEKWQLMSASAATIALNVAEKHQATLVFTGSSILALAAVYMHKQLKAFQADIRTVHLSHDSAFSSFWQERNEHILAMDYLIAQWTKFTPNAKIGYVSHFMKNLFSEKYMVEENGFIPARGGVFLNEARFRKLSSAEMVDILNKHNLPLDKKIIFSWGRPIGYKRLDLVFKVAKVLQNRVFPVAVTNENYPSLRQYFNQLQIPGALVENYRDFELINALLQWPNTVCSCLLSEDEPGALAPMEAMYAARDTGSIVLGNNSGIYLEVIENGRNGFITDNKTENIIDKLEYIMNMEPERATELRKNAHETILKRFNQKVNYIDTICACVPHIQRHYSKLAGFINDEDSLNNPRRI